MRKMTRTHVTPRPFLKWVGGKGQLLPVLWERVRRARFTGRYHEPFVGGGALFFDLYRRGAVGRKKAFLSDNNGRLIETYHGIQLDVEHVIELLEDHKAAHNKDYYYQVRANVPDDPIERAARLIYLNRTCFNGLFRENSKGLFNVPMGKYKNPAICDAENLRAVSVALAGARIEQRPFADVLRHAKAGDLVYFDPPYHPLSTTSSFTAYHQGGFTEDDQRSLGEVFRELDKRGVKVLLSNSMTPLIQEIYAGFTLDKVFATRNINSRADRRGKISEVLVRNF